MIFPFVRFRLDKDGLVKGKTTDQIWKEATNRFIKDVKENRPDAEEDKKEMDPSSIEVPHCLKPFFNGYDACYAFHQLSYRGQSTGYMFNLEEYLTKEQKEWVDSWLVIEDGYTNLVKSAVKLRGLIGEQKYLALANAIDPKINQFINSEDAMYSSDDEWHCARISVIGISDFGENLTKKLQKYHNSISQDFRCNFLNISNSYEVEYLPKTFCERSDLIVIIAQEDQMSLKEISKVLNTLNGKDQLIVGFFNGFKQYDFGPKLTNRVDITENEETAYQALRLLPDLIALSLIIAIDFNDIKTAFLATNSFKVAVKEAINKIDLADTELSNSKSIIFGIYGDENMYMKDIDDIAVQIFNRANKDTKIIFSADLGEPKGTETRVVMFY